MEFLHGQRLETTVAIAVAVVAVAAGAAYLFLRSRKTRGEPFCASSVTNNPARVRNPSLWLLTRLLSCPRVVNTH